MREILLAATIALISVAAHADPSFQVAQSDLPQAPSAGSAVEPAKVPEPTKATEPAKATEPPPVADTKPVQPLKPKRRAAHRESDEHKARRIAAKYGVYW
jgi:hypothetical protein